MPLNFPPQRKVIKPLYLSHSNLGQTKQFKSHCKKEARCFNCFCLYFFQPAKLRKSFVGKLWNSLHPNSKIRMKYTLRCINQERYFSTLVHLYMYFLTPLTQEKTCKHKNWATPQSVMDTLLWYPYVLLLDLIKQIFKTTLTLFFLMFYRCSCGKNYLQSTSCVSPL